MRHQLKDITEIQLGYQFRGKVESGPGGTHRVIQIKDIDDDQCLRMDDLDAFTPKRDPHRYLVQQGDVLFLSRGHRNYAVNVTEPPEDTVVASYFYILRPDGNVIRPAYLAWWINQDPIQAELASLSGGSHMPLIRRSDFEQLPVEIPALSTQDTIAKLDDLLREERQLLRRLEDRRRRLAEHRQRTITDKCLLAAYGERD